MKNKADQIQRIFLNRTHRARQAWQASQMVARWTLREIGANLVALNLYPLGSLLDLNDRAESHVNVGLNPRPVLLVHGVIHNSSAFVAIRREMKRQGWKNIFTLDYKTRHGRTIDMVQQLAEKVEEICAQTGATQIDIVGHSLGGIIARYYMCVGKGRKRVKHLVTLGAPHRGTTLSVLLNGFTFGALGTDLRTDSYFIQLLNETVIPRGSRLTSIFARYDWTIWPRGNCAIQELPRQAVENIEVENTGHMGLLYSRLVAELTMKALLA